MQNKAEKKIKQVLIHGFVSKKNKQEYNYTIHYKDGTKKDEKAHINQIFSKYKNYLPDDVKNETDSSTESTTSSKEQPKKKIVSVEVGDICLEPEKNSRMPKHLTPYLHLLTFYYDNGKKKHKQLSLEEIKKNYENRLDSKNMQFVLTHKCKTLTSNTTPLPSPWPDDKPENKDSSSSEEHSKEETDCSCTLF